LWNYLLVTVLPTHRHDETPPSLLALHRLHLALVKVSNRLVELELGEDVEEVGVDLVVDAISRNVSASYIPLPTSVTFNDRS
jgi:hypothetical protein